MIGGLDLGYWNEPDRWHVGWRPDGFFDLPLKTQQKIERKVKRKKGGYALGKRLVEEETP